MKLILTGATGAAGSQILRDAVSDPTITSITVLSRRALPSWLTDALPKDSDNKVSTVVLDDFLNYPANLPSKLAQHDACIWALGTSSRGMNEQDYTKITYDYVVSAISALEDVKDRPEDNPFRFVFISGEGADPTEKSKMLFGRIKGRTERFLHDLPPESRIKTHSLRPGFFYPTWKEVAGNIWAPTRRRIANLLGPLMMNSWRLAIPVNDLSKFSIEAAKGKWGVDPLFNNYRMRELLSGK